MQMHNRKVVWLTYVGGSMWRGTCPDAGPGTFQLMCAGFYHHGHSLCSCGASSQSQILKLQVVKQWAFLPPQLFLVSNTDLLPCSPHGLLAQQSTPFLTMRPTMANPWLSTPCLSHMRTEKSLRGLSLSPASDALSHILSWGAWF